MTTKTLIEVEVPEGEEIYYYATRKIQPYSLFNGFYQRHTTFRLVPPARAVPDALLDRIEEALRRFVSGSAARRIPADETDGDLVLYDLQQVRAGKPMKWAREEFVTPTEPARAAGDEVSVPREAFEEALLLISTLTDPNAKTPGRTDASRELLPKLRALLSDGAGGDKC